MLSLPLFAARVVHFASTVLIAGTVVFLVFIETSAISERGNRTTLASFHDRLLVIVWVSLAISIVSGAAWLLFLVAKVTGSPLAQAISDGTARTFLTSTQFGHTWEVRLVFAALLVVALLRFKRSAGWTPVEGLIAAALAMGFAGALAWSGHGGATPGLRGDIHVAADALHLVAAGAWIGGLLPLTLLLSRAEGLAGAAGVRIARGIVVRFSTLGMAAVATLIMTGAVNTWILVGSVHALLESEYGQLLLLKIAIFLVLLAVAAVNRMRLTPRLKAAADGGFETGMGAMRRLKWNCVVETTLGLAILIVVGGLGAMSPGMNM